MCLAVYTLARGQRLRGFMVETIADRLGITLEQAEETAATADAAGLVRHQHGTAILTGKGQDRGAKLMPPAVRKTANRRRLATRPSPGVKHRARSR